uniref:Uncharacterized protein n=1 Tax=Knipowitschia caucasica TaxID=637954 RepID=A0AAV2KMF1_KNICA
MRNLRLFLTFSRDTVRSSSSADVHSQPPVISVIPVRSARIPRCSPVYGSVPTQTRAEEAQRICAPLQKT